jgi:hypothetical protein
MRKSFGIKNIILAVFVFFLFQSCGNKGKPENSHYKHKGVPCYEMGINAHDTINKMDGDSVKQGLWIETVDGKSDRHLKDRDTAIYQDGVVVKRGLKSTALLTKKISLEGQYNGKNLFIKNTYGKGGVGYCVMETKVNGKTTTDEINADMFMIDLVSLGLKNGEKIKIEIFHKEGCTPRSKPLILNPGAISISRETEKGVASFVIEGKYNYQNIFVSNSVGLNGKGFGIKEIKLNGKTISTNINLANLQINLLSMNFKDNDHIKIEFKYAIGYDPMIVNPEGLN